MIDVGFFSNGHGEDTIACKVLDRIRETRPSLSIEGWPMVGEGSAYRSRDVPLVGALNLLPSSGFATISPKLMLDDLRAGWIGTHWRQYKAAREMRGRYRIAVAVGDIIPILAAVTARAPFTFIGCAKSYHYHPGRAYTPLERRLLRKHCMLTFPRDEMTIPELDKDGVHTLYLGNPMMDGLEGTGDRLGIGPDNLVIGMLAGTRPDAEINLLDLLDAAGHAHHHFADAQNLRFVFAARQSLDPGAVAGMISDDRRFADWRVLEVTDANAGIVLRLADSRGVEALVVKDRFADVLHLSSIVVGMAGTANEQAIGLGKPLITVPSAGVQGDQYVKMKSVYFGDAALAVPRDPNAISAAIARLLDDPEQRQRMAEAGRERMGDPGASQAIADTILAVLDGGTAKVAAQ
ncbi:MAG: lipid-A-disaccharide synthase-related protein [Rhizobiaceae bacterium]